MLSIIAAVALLLTAPVVPAVGQESGAEAGSTPAIGLDMTVRGRPLILGRARSRMSVTIRLEQAVDNLELRVQTFGDSSVRTLLRGPRSVGTFSRTWDGRDDGGQIQPAGAYRIVARATLDGVTSTVDDWVTVARRKVYPRRPGYITVAVDPGHGGDADGALGRDGTREADINLDIGLRLTRMLEGAGVNVVTTRTTDSNVNEPPEELTGDGVIDYTDELAARPDVANRARADLFIAVHNNEAVNKSVGGPSTFYYDRRPFGDRSARLARIVQAEVVSALSRFANGSWEPFDHGALIYPYYVLRGVDPRRSGRPPRLRRPTQMPGVLSEGLFLTNPRELSMLKRAAVRQAIAEGYYNAIARYLARRSSQVGYVLSEAPVLTASGDKIRAEVEVRNKGNSAMRSWKLVVGILPAPVHYEGRGRAGRSVATRRIPKLEPGQSVWLRVSFSAPQAGEWLLLFDARDRRGRRASRAGSPMLQVPLTTLAPVPTDQAVPTELPVPSSTSTK